MTLSWSLFNWRQATRFLAPELVIWKLELTGKTRGASESEVRRSKGFVLVLMMAAQIIVSSAPNPGG